MGNICPVCGHQMERQEGTYTFEATFHRLVRENARASSVLEGASPAALREVDAQTDRRNVIAPRKNPSQVQNAAHNPRALPGDTAVV